MRKRLQGVGGEKEGVPLMTGGPTEWVSLEDE